MIEKTKNAFTIYVKKRNLNAVHLKRQMYTSLKYMHLLSACHIHQQHTTYMHNNK